jgi:hypothetical protein
LREESKEIRNAIASLAIEGLTPSDFAIELAEMQLRGEIRREEIVERILEYYEVEGNEKEEKSKNQKQEK